MVGHISRFDTSEYGYVGYSIEQFDLAKLKVHLEYYKNSKAKLNIFKSGKSLLDLALDNLPTGQKPEVAKEIIDILLSNEAIDPNIVAQGTGHSFLSHLIELISKTQDKGLQDYLLNKIDKLDPDVLLELKSPEFEAAIKVLRDNQKPELADKVQILKAIQEGNIKLVEQMVATDPTILSILTSKGANLLKVAALNDQHDIQDFLIIKGLDVDFELRIAGKRINYLGNLINDGEKGVRLINQLISKGSVLNLLDEENIKAIYLGSQKKPSVPAGYDKIFNDLLDKGFLNKYLGLKLESAGVVFGADVTVKDFALNNLDVSKLNVLLLTNSLDFSTLTDAQKDALVELFSKNYDQLHDNKRAFQAEVLNYVVKKHKWRTLGGLLESGAVNPKDLGENAEIVMQAYLDGKLKGKVSDKNLVELMQDNLTFRLSKDHGKHGPIKTGGFTMLHAVALLGDEGILTGLLISPNINEALNLKTNQDQTPLAIAQQLKHQGIAKALVESGAELQVKELQSGWIYGVSQRESNPLHAALTNQDIGLALRIVQSKQFAALGKDDQEKKAIYDLLKLGVNENSKEHINLLEQIIQKCLLPLTIGKTNILADLTKLAIDSGQSQLLGNLINHNHLEPEQLKQVVDLIIQSGSLDLVKFSKGMLDIMEKPGKAATFIKLLVDGLIETERYSDLIKLKDAGLVEQDLVAQRMAGKDILFRLYNPQAKELLEIQLHQANKKEVSQKDDQGATMLHYACYNGQLELAKKLFGKGADPFTPHAMTGMTPLMMLAVSKHNENAQMIFAEFAKDPDFLANLRKRKGEAMHILFALKNDNIELANAFITELEPKLADYKGKTSSEQFQAAQEEYKKIKAAIHTDIFYRAINSNDAQLVTNFLKLKSSKNFNPAYITVNLESEGRKVTHRLNPLFMVLRNNNMEIFKALLNSQNKHIDLNSTDLSSVDQYSLLQEAMLLGRSEAVKALLDKDSEQSKPDQALKLDLSTQAGKENLTPLNLAYNRMLELEGLVAKEPDPIKKKTLQNEVNEIYKSMNLLLTYNQKQGKSGQRIDINASLTVELIDPKDHERRKFNILTDSYQRLMNERIKKEPNEERIKQLEEFILNILHTKDVNLDIINEYGQNLLMLAAQQGDFEVVAAVALNKQSESNVNQVDHLGNTALIYAAQSGNTKLYGYLLSEGAEPTVNKQGVNSLMAACNSGHLGIVELLKPTIEDLTKRDIKGNTPLHYLVTNSAAFKQESEEKQKEREAILDKFISLEADINAQNAEGKTPLILAVMSGDVAMVKKLMQNGAKVNLADKEGNTPLIYATLLNDRFMIEALLGNKALQVNHKNNDGVSAYLVAASRQGLEAFKAKEGAFNELSAAEKEEINQIGSNTYPKLVETLIDRGADPYESDPNPVLWNVAKTIVKATALSAANHYLFQSVPIGQEVGKSIIAGYTAKKMYETVGKGVETSVKNFFNDGTERDGRVNLSNKLMIGTFHDKGLGGVKYGESLHGAVNSHASFKNADNGIYTVAQLKDAVQKPENKTSSWPMNAHGMLTAKYINIIETINNRPWYYKFPLFWKTTALRNVAKEILQADKLLLKTEKTLRITQDGQTAEKNFEQFFGNEPNSLLTIIKSTKTSKQLLSSMLQEPKTEIMANANTIIDLVVNNKILVAPDTFAAFLKFSQQLKELEQHSKARKVFSAANKPLDEEFIKGKDVIEFNFKAGEGALSIAERFVETRTALVARAKAEEQQEVRDKSVKGLSYSENLVKSVAYFTGQAEKDIVDVTAKTAGNIAGVGAGLLAGMAVDDKIYKVISAGAVAVSLIPGAALVGIAGAAIGGAALVTSAPTLAGWAQSVWQALPNFGSGKNQEQVLIAPPPANITEASRLNIKTQDLLSGELRDKSNITSQQFDIRPVYPPLPFSAAQKPSVTTQLNTSTSMQSVADPQPKVRGAKEIGGIGVASSQNKEQQSADRLM